MIRLDKYLELVHARKIEEYNSMILKGESYISVQSYKNITNNINLIATADIPDRKHKDQIFVNYKLDDTIRFKSIVNTSEYFGKDFSEIVNISSKEKPVIKSDNGEPFTISLNIDSKTVKLGIDKNSIAVTRDKRVEIYKMIGGSVNWSELKEIYQIYKDGYVFIDLNGKFRKYERLYLDGSSVTAYKFRDNKNICGDLYLDMNPKKVKWRDRYGSDESNVDFDIKYDRSGMITEMYSINNRNFEEKRICEYDKDVSNKTTYSFHPVVFDPFKLENFNINNWHIWVLETRKIDFGYQIYDRQVFWINDYENIINMIPDLSII